jgi:hypothetical protein
MHKNPNPFAQEDLFVEIVKLDDDVNKSMRDSLHTYLSKNQILKPTLMTRFQKVLTFFTTHTLTAVVTATICLGTIGTFAAQTVAPEQYKPTTVINNLFKNNKIQQTNPNTPLVSDASNDVVSYDPCNISIKYPKQIAGEKIVATLPQDYNQPGDKTIPDYYGVTVMSQKSFKYDTTSQLQGNIDFSCSKEYISPLDNNLNSKMSPQELADLTGWFITGEQKLEEISTENQATSGPFRTVYFKFNNFYYRIAFTAKKIPANILSSQTEDVKKFWNNAIGKPGIFGDQVQIQFNDVAKNVPNAEILKFDNVPTSGFKFEYDKVLILDSKTLYDINGPEKFEFRDPGSRAIYSIVDKNLQEKISKLGLNIGDSIKFSGQVTNSDSKINVNTQEEFVITKIDNVARTISEAEKLKLDSTPKPITFDNYEPVFFSKMESVNPLGDGDKSYFFLTRNKTLIVVQKGFLDRAGVVVSETQNCFENCDFNYVIQGTAYYNSGPGGASYTSSPTPKGESLFFGYNGGGGPRIISNIFDDKIIQPRTDTNNTTPTYDQAPVRTDTNNGSTIRPSVGSYNLQNKKMFFLDTTYIDEYTRFTMMDDDGQIYHFGTDYTNFVETSNPSCHPPVSFTGELTLAPNDNNHYALRGNLTNLDPNTCIRY